MTDSFRWPLDEEVQALDLEQGTITTLPRRGPIDEQSAKPDTIDEEAPQPVEADLSTSAKATVDPPKREREGGPVGLRGRAFKGAASKGAAWFAARRGVARRWVLPVLAVVVAVESVLLAWAFLKADATSGAAVTSASNQVSDSPVVSGSPVVSDSTVPSHSDVVSGSDAGKASTPTQPTTNEPVRPSPPPAATTPIAPTGSVAIAMPFQVEVYEGGRLVGLSGGKSITLSPGSHQLELVNESLEDRASLPVTVFSNQTTRPAVALPTGTLSLNASPWAEVLIDGKAIGETPLANVRVPIGPHRIVFRHPQFPEQTRSVVVTAQSSMRIGVDLEK